MKRAGGEEPSDAHGGKKPHTEAPTGASAMPLRPQARPQSPKPAAAAHLHHHHHPPHPHHHPHHHHPPTRQQQQQPPPPPPLQHQRSAAALLVALERQRQAYLDAAGDLERERRAFAADSAEAPAAAEWLLDDDGGGENGGNVRARELELERAFVETSAAAAGACRAWRDASRRAAHKAVLDLSAAATPPSSSPLSAVRAHSGGALRVLIVRGRPASSGPLRELARALGISPAGAAAAAAPAAADERGVVTVARGLERLRVQGAGSLLRRLRLSPPTATTPSPPLLLSNLVVLELDRFRSTWASLSPQAAGASSGPRPLFSRATLPLLKQLKVTLTPDSDCPLQIAHGGPHGTDAGPAYQPLPLLEALRVTRPDEATPAPPSGDPHVSARWPPGEPLLVSLRSLDALGPTLKAVFVGSTWAVPMSGSSCAVLTSGRGGQGGGGGYGAGAISSSSSWSGDGGQRRSLSPGEEEEVDDGGPQVAHPDWCELASRDIRSHNALPPAEIAPMARLERGVAALTRLTALALSSEYDWSPPSPLPLGDGAQAEAVVGGMSPMRVRWDAWQAAARRVLSPLSHLRRLEITLDAADGHEPPSDPVVLPHALSTLSSLTCLEIRAAQLMAAGRLQRCLQLRRLVVEERENPPGLEGRLSCAIHGVHLITLQQLEYLRLSSASPCLALVIKHRLPRLASLTLRRGLSAVPIPRGDDEGDEDDEEDGVPQYGPATPIGVWRAALARQRRDGLAVCASRDMDDRAPARLSAQQVEELVEAREQAGEEEDELGYEDPEEHLAAYEREANKPDGDGGGAEGEDQQLAVAGAVEEDE
jgi:hypothetical protein